MSTLGLREVKGLTPDRLVGKGRGGMQVLLSASLRTPHLASSGSALVTVKCGMAYPIPWERPLALPTILAVQRLIQHHQKKGMQFPKLFLKN